MYCQSCGSELKDGIVKCPNCHPVSKETRSVLKEIKITGGIALSLFIIGILFNRYFSRTAREGISAWICIMLGVTAFKAIRYFGSKK
jgi:hypothetical protein